MQKNIAKCKEKQYKRNSFKGSYYIRLDASIGKFPYSSLLQLRKIHNNDNQT